MENNNGNRNTKMNQKIMDELKNLGVKIVDISNYPTHHCGLKGNISIIAGYVPGKAAVFIVKSGGSGDLKFTVDGQIRNTPEAVKLLRTGFQEIKRSPVESESYGGHLFSINTYTGYCSANDAVDIERGITFFKNVIDDIGIFLENRFTESVHLWFVPVYSDEYEKMKKQNGPGSDKTHKYFNKKVMDKFPEDFFAKEQRC